MQASIESSRQAPDLTRMPIARAVLMLAVPVAASQFLETSYNVVNGIWVGRVGTDALAAINASAFFVWLIYSQLGVVCTGASALVANCVGAGRRAQAEQVARQACVLALIVAAALCVGGLVAHHALLQWMGLTEGVVEQGRRYLWIIFLVLPAIATNEVLAAVLRGYGDTRTPTLVWTGVLLVNIALLPVLVQGMGPVPAMGITGAALSTALAMLVGVATYGMLARCGRLPFRMRAPEGVGRGFMKDIVRIGFPTSFSAVVFSLVYMGLTRIISGFGTAGVAAVGIGHRVESICYLVALSFSMAAITMVGQNKGAGLIARARRSAWTAVGMAGVVAIATTVVMVRYPESLARVFSQDPAVVEAAASYIRIIGATQFFMALDIVLEGAFSGAGNTVPPMVCSIPLTLARIPAAWWVAEHLHAGLVGVWWVISGLMLVRGIVIAWWFSRGYWERHEVLRAEAGGHEALALGTEDPTTALHADLQR